MDQFKIPEKKFDGKWFKARQWATGRKAASEWAETYRKAGYLARVVKGVILVPGMETQWPDGLGGKPVKHRIIREDQGWIVYLRRA